MLNQDYKDILLTLSDHNVDFMLVGAYALAFHGYPRATGDIDIFYKPSSENAIKVWDALTDFGAPMSQITINDLLVPGTIFQIGIAPRRIDMINRISGVTYDEASIDSKLVTIENIQIRVISIEKLKANKKASGRPKDLVDLDTLSANG
ncbi:MAG: nucleotidyltransferase [Fibrobacteres bacterium]|nr:nucleotidyltransferase [Fibrobacterota bacterium]